MYYYAFSCLFMPFFLLIDSGRCSCTMESCTFYPIASVLETQDGLGTRCRQYERLWRCCTHTASTAWLISASELQ